MSTVDVAIVGYPGVLLSTLYGLVEFFKSANAWSDANSPQFALHCWCHPHTGIPIPDGVKLIDCSMPPLPDVIIVPPASQEPAPGVIDETLAHWLRFAYERGTTLASACVGAYVLGEAGVLEGHTVTTHWLLADTFRSRFPGVNVIDAQALLVDGTIITAAGLTSWIDVALRVVNRLASAELAMKLSAYFLLDAAYREQRYYQVFSPPNPHKDALVTEVQTWLERNCARDFDTRTLAQEVGASTRTIQRRFLAVMGMTLGAYLQQLRMQRACSLLATTEYSVESIVWEVGYRDVSGFRRLFKERIGLTPSEYRSRFWLATPTQATQ